MSQEKDLGLLEPFQADPVEVEIFVLVVEFGLALVCPLDGLLRRSLIALENRKGLIVGHWLAFRLFAATAHQ